MPCDCNVIICYSHSILTPYLPNPSPLKLQNFTTQNGSLMSVCRFGISFKYVIEVIESKLISVCLINDYSRIPSLLPANFVFRYAPKYNIKSRRIK